ncbi:Cro/CI family transcriptional regulator [Xenophilus sp.]|uniref:Cro/CI family transcriptional regulator n=1 Tax=Xenophilus sp. TaxID=1873499 RepID=UPI0037DD4C0D
MKTADAIDKAKTAAALADMLGITPSAVSQWGDEVPEARVWQLRVLKPDWFNPASPELATPTPAEVAEREV